MSTIESDLDYHVPCKQKYSPTHVQWIAHLINYLLIFILKFFIFSIDKVSGLGLIIHIRICSKFFKVSSYNFQSYLNLYNIMMYSINFHVNYLHLTVLYFHLAGIHSKILSCFHHLTHSSIKVQSSLQVQKWKLSFKEQLRDKGGLMKQDFQ